MHSGCILLLLVLVGIITAELIGHRHRSDMSDWHVVQQSLANLHSVLDREPARQTWGVINDICNCLANVKPIPALVVRRPPEFERSTF